MAVKASATVTLSSVVDVKSVWRYYKLQASTLSKPSKPTTNPPSGWTTTEPSYTDGSTNSLYFCDLTVFCDSTFSYSDVSLSSSYEAAKAAYNKAQAAKDAADNAQNTANSKGIDYSQGKMLYTDPIFDSGLNSVKVYNNSKNGTVTVTRTEKSSYNPFSGASYQLEIANTGTSSPGCGGFYFGNTSRANAVFIYRIFAKIPVGRNIGWAANAFGNASSATWLTSQAGTGKFTEYVCKAVCGATGSFSTIGFFYITGSVGTTSEPVKWYVAYATCFDMTTTSDTSSIAKRVTAAETSITNNQNEIKLKATKTEVTEAVNNIQVGGRNLLVGTSKSVTHTGTGSINEVSTLYKRSGYYNNSITKLQGIQLTLSFDWETTATSGKFLMQLDGRPWTILSSWIAPSSSNQSGKSVYTVTCNAELDTSTYTGLGIRSDNLTGTITIKNAMLELGNKASSWQPAPEDVYADATAKANNALASAKTYTDAQLKVTSESITSTVSKTYATITSLNTTNSNVTTAQNTANAAKTAASNAQSTADTAKTNAATAQSTANTAKTNAATAQSTADSVKNNLANNYSTTEQIAETYTTQTEFTQTSDEIRMDFTKSITSASNDLQSQIADSNTAANDKFAEINKYIRFVDGKIVLGETGNELMLTIQNDRVSFTQAGVEVAYFSNNNLYIKRAEVLTTLKVGNYEFSPRDDGGLALRKRSV